MNFFCLVTDAFGSGGGIAQFNRDLLGALADLPETASVVVLPRHGQTDVTPERLQQLPAAPGRFSYVLRALATARRSRPDVIFCGHLHLLPLAALMGAWWKVPVWLQVHGIDAWRAPSRLIRTLVARAALVTSVSRFTRARFLSWAALPDWRVKVLPNTVGARYRPQDRDAARARWQLGDRPVLLTVGRLAASEAYKGQDRVLRCLPALRVSHPGLVYLIAGDGDDRHRLEQLATELGVDGAVSFLGAVDHGDLPALYAAADVFAMPSTGEGFGIVFLEAMACGTPVVALDEDGSRDPLRDGHFGQLTKREHLAQTLDDALAQARPPQLADEVRAVFGHAAFVGQVRHLMQASFQSTLQVGA